MQISLRKSSALKLDRLVLLAPVFALAAMVACSSDSADVAAVPASTEPTIAEPTNPSSTGASAPTETSAASTAADAGIRVLANAKPNPPCVDGCSSTITIHDGSGAEVSRLEFPNGYVDVQRSAAIDYPNRILVAERLTSSHAEGFVSHLVDTDAGVVIAEYPHEGLFAYGEQLAPGSRLALLGVPVDDTNLIVDLETGESFRIPAGKPMMSTNQRRLGVDLDSRVAIFDANDLGAPPTYLDVPVASDGSPPSGTTVLGFSPGGDQFAFSYQGDSATDFAHYLRVVDLTDNEQLAETEYELPAPADGWLSDGEVIMAVSDSPDGFILYGVHNLTSGATSDLFPSAHGLLDGFGETSRLPWHVARIGKQVELLKRATGETVIVESPDEMQSWWTQLDPAAIWINDRDRWQANEPGISIAMIDLNVGKIVWYEDLDFGVGHPFAYQFSHDKSKIIVEQNPLGPVDLPADGRLLADGEILALAAIGHTSFCDDDTYIVASAAGTARYQIGSTEPLAEFGQQHDIICVG